MTERGEKNWLSQVRYIQEVGRASVEPEEENGVMEMGTGTKEAIL
jgi:hypothetical protein